MLERFICVEVVQVLAHILLTQTDLYFSILTLSFVTLWHCTTDEVQRTTIERMIFNEFGRVNRGRSDEKSCNTGTRS